MSTWDFVARLIVLLVTLPIHEYAHARIAVALGDPTPANEGRLSLNPFRHLDLFGSMALLILGFGWAKPVMVDSRNFKRPKRDMALTSLAGPLANVGMALAALILLKAADYLLPFSTAANAVFNVIYLIVTINIQLAVFNLLPIPPLDGSKILGILLPDKAYRFVLRYERYVMLLVMALLWFDILDRPILFLASKLLSALDWLTTPVDLLFRAIL